MPRRVSSLTTTPLGTALPQLSVPVSVADGVPSVWWHPVAAAAAGSHHALHSMLAFGPATSVKTIDRTIARNTERSLTPGQDSRPGLTTSMCRFTEGFAKWRGPQAARPCGIPPIGAENPAVSPAAPEKTANMHPGYFLAPELLKLEQLIP